MTAAAHGADLVIHHLGESTLAEAETLRAEIIGLGRRAVLVAGDISEAATADRVSEAVADGFLAAHAGMT